MYTIDHLIETRENEDPGGIAFYRNTPSGVLPVTTRAFCTEKRALAYTLETLGLTKGAVVGILSSVRYEWELIEKAILSVGATSFGIDVRHTLSEITTEIEMGSIAFLFVENDTLLKNIPDTFSGTTVLIESKTESGRSVEYLTTLIERGAGMKPNQKALPDDYAIIISTSGTTGVPKLIRYRNRHIVAACLSIIETLGLNGEEAKKDKVTLCWLPLVYMTSKIMNLVDYAVHGSVHFLGNPRDITSALQTINPSHFVAVPIFYERLYKGLQDELDKLPLLKRIGVHTILFIRMHTPLRFGSSVTQMIRTKLFGKHLEYTISGSAPLGHDIMRFFNALGIRVLEAYALSENTIPVAMNTPTNHKIGSVGKPLPRNKVTLAEDGEILVSGDGVFEGYMGHESENTEYFTAHGYLKTGDIGTIDHDGFLYITGRKKSLIKTANGYRISPTEVETAYETSLYIKQIVVVGDRQKFLGALIVLDIPHVEAALSNLGIKKMSPGALTTHREVQKLIRSELEKYGAELAVYKRVACFTLLVDPFSVERGELTPNFKLRRDIIIKHHEDTIESMFKKADTQ